MGFLPKNRTLLKQIFRSVSGKTGTVLIAIFISCFLFAPAYPGEIVEKVKREKSVIVGITADAPPFSYSTDEEGHLKGFDVEITEVILEGVNLTPMFLVVDPIELIPLVAEGEIQMVPGLAHKMGWERVIDFSVTYFNGGTGVVVKKSSSITKLNHLKRKKVALPSGISAEEVSTMIPDVVLLPTENISSGLKLLKERRVVGVAGNIRDILKTISEEEKPERFIIIEELLSKIPYAVGVPPTDARWREMIDFSMMKMFESGLYREIYERWFGKYSRTKYPFGYTIELWPK